MDKLKMLIFPQENKQVSTKNEMPMRELGLFLCSQWEYYCKIQQYFKIEQIPLWT